MTGEAGAVSNPLALMAPALEDHVTVELKAPVPWTVALHSEVVSTPVMGGLQTTATEVICGADEDTATVPPPHAVPAKKISASMKQMTS